MPPNYYCAALYLILYNADRYSSASFVKLSNIHGIPKTDPSWWYFEPLWKITSTEMLRGYVNKLGRGNYNLTHTGYGIYTKMNSKWNISKALEIYLSVNPPDYITIYHNITNIINSPDDCL
jgi:hypothetical protein